MSSLRLALKQSLQESGGGSSGRRGEDGRKKRRPGDPRRKKRGRYKNSHRGDSDDDNNNNNNDDDQQQRQSNNPPPGGGVDDDDHGSSSDENEFNEDEVEDDEDEEEEDDEEEEGESDNQGGDDHSHTRRFKKSSQSHQEGSAPPSASNSRAHSEEEGEEDSEVERKRQRRKLQKKLKHSAAHKIQSQWKKKKSKDGSPSKPSAEELDSKPSAARRASPPSIPAASSSEQPSIHSHPHLDTDHDDDEDKPPKAGDVASKKDHQDQQQHEDDDDHDGDGHDKKNKNKPNPSNERGKAKTAKTVPPPEPHVLEWNRSLPINRSRRNITQGLRVKVRFATKVKREGKIIRKKKWFGGRVSAVSKEGSKIRIKYDDGTKEISKFPDKDIVVDNVGNGQHQANAAKFVPPRPKVEEEDDEEEEEGEVVEEQMDTTQQQQQPPEPQPQKPVESVFVTKPATELKEQDKAEKVQPADNITQPSAATPSAVEEPEPPRKSPVEASMPPQQPQDQQQQPSVAPPAAESYDEEPARPSSPPIEGMPFATTTTTTSSSTQQQHHASVEEKEKPRSRSPSPPQEPSRSISSTAVVDSDAPKTNDAKEEAPAPEKMQVEDESAQQEEEPPAAAEQSDAKPKEEKTVVEQQPAEKPRPTLKIRLTNPNKDRHVSGTETTKPQKTSPRPPKPMESSGEDGPSEPKTAAESKPEVSDTVAETTTAPQEEAEDATTGSKKRRYEESTSESDVAAPPTKRIHIRSSQVAEAKEKSPPVEATDSTSATQPPSSEIQPPRLENKDKAERPVSRQSNEGKASTTSSRPNSSAPAEADGDMDVDDGPVKISSRNSGKRVPLFSDEEDEPTLSSNKPRKPTPVIAEDKPKNSEDTVEVKAQRPLAKKASKSEIASVEPSDAEKSTETAFRGDKAVVITSKNSAFERKEISSVPEEKEVTKDDELGAAAAAAAAPASSALEPNSGAIKAPRRPSTPHEKPDLSSSTSGVRSGRKAAQQANERIVSSKPEKAEKAEKSEVVEKEKEKDKEPSAGPNKKRKKRRESDDDSEGGPNDNHNNWIQCDSCKKWRIIPNDVDVNALPDRWYCHLNVHDPQHNTCEAPEETTAPVPKKRKRGRKRIRQRAEEAAKNAEQTTTLSRKDSSQSQSDSGKERLRARSPVPKEETSKPKEAAKPKEVAKPKEAAPARANSTPKPTRSSPSSIASAEKSPAPAEIGSESPTKPEKKISAGRKRLPDAPLETIPEAPVEPKVKRGRGRRKELKEDNRGGKTTGSVASSNQNDIDLDNVEWVQCEKCEKWRKLPAHISADELPDVWYCKLNTWNPTSATCDAPEDKADGQQDIGVFGGTSGYGSKLSYRSLIFGSGRKVNRPVSERTRAAESIFAAPLDETEVTYPQVMYANSSAFAPRGSRANIIEEESTTISVFELMNHSNLWAELRGMSQPLNPTASALGAPGLSDAFMPKYSFGTLPPNMKQDMKDMILRALGTRTLLPEEVLLECQCRQWDNAPPSWAEVRAYCTKDLVITLLCELVTEGTVQLVQAFGNEWTVKDWNPRYKLASTASNENVAPQPQKNTRCMKIAKPWKRAASST